MLYGSKVILIGLVTFRSSCQLQRNQWWAEGVYENTSKIIRSLIFKISWLDFEKLGGQVLIN